MMIIHTYHIHSVEFNKSDIERESVVKEVLEIYES